MHRTIGQDADGLALKMMQPADAVGTKLLPQGGTLSLTLTQLPNRRLLHDRLDRLLRRLRMKIDEGQPLKLIQTVRGMGYVLDVPEEE